MKARAKQVTQVIYNMWGSETKEHASYFDDISRIAEWIAWGLEAQQTGFSLAAYQYSTIAVHQSKEKYGTVRVYCTLADSGKVRRAWAAELRKWRKRADGSPRPSRQEFVQKCAQSDMRWYREVYMKAIASWPHYETAIKRCADMDVLLMHEDELDKAVLQRRMTKAESDAYRAIISEIP